MLWEIVVNIRVTSEHMFPIMFIYNQIAHRWRLQSTFNDTFALVKVRGKGHQATNQYLSQYWLTSMLPSVAAFTNMV